MDLNQDSIILFQTLQIYRVIDVFTSFTRKNIITHHILISLIFNILQSGQFIIFYSPFISPL